MQIERNGQQIEIPAFPVETIALSEEPQNRRGYTKDSPIRSQIWVYLLSFRTRKQAETAARKLGWPLNAAVKLYGRFEYAWILQDAHLNCVSMGKSREDLRNEPPNGKPPTAKRLKNFSVGGVSGDLQEIREPGESPK